MIEALYKKTHFDQRSLIYYNKDKRSSKKYDYLSLLLFKNKSTLIKYETNLISEVTNKSISIVFTNGSLEWIHNFRTNHDLVRYTINKQQYSKLFKKNRSQEFISELKHIFTINNDKKYNNSRINLKRGLKVMKFIKQSFKINE